MFQAVTMPTTRLKQETKAAVQAIAQAQGISEDDAIALLLETHGNQTDTGASQADTEGDGYDTEHTRGDLALFPSSSQPLSGASLPLEVTHRVVDERQNERLTNLEEAFIGLGAEVAVNRAGIENMLGQQLDDDQPDPLETVDVMNAARAKLLERGGRGKRLAGYLAALNEPVEAEGDEESPAETTDEGAA